MFGLLLCRSGRAKNKRRTYVDASVFKWGQIKTRKLCLTICNSFHQALYKKYWRKFVIVYFYPQWLYKVCVNIGSFNVVGWSGVKIFSLQVQQDYISTDILSKKRFKKLCTYCVHRGIRGPQTKDKKTTYLESICLRLSNIALPYCRTVVLPYCYKENVDSNPPSRMFCKGGKCRRSLPFKFLLFDQGHI